MAKSKPQKQTNDSIVFILLAIVVVQSLFLIASCQKKERPPVRVPQRIAPKPQPRVKEKPKEKAPEGQIAIVLDDWGYSLTGLKYLSQINEKLTLSILPHLLYSTEIARKAQELSQEVILHLPLEPKEQEYYRLEKDTILTTMNESQILRIVRSDLNSLPNLKGVSNHMGSKATEDRRTMKIIFEELKKKQLYFLDSFTSKTICERVAEEVSLPYARRHVFLDNKKDPQYIKAQIETLVKVAKQQGFVIGIGHARPMTLEVLVEVIPELKKRGFVFVGVSEVLDRR